MLSIDVLIDQIRLRQSLSGVLFVFADRQNFHVFEVQMRHFLIVKSSAGFLNILYFESFEQFFDG